MRAFPYITDVTHHIRQGSSIHRAYKRGGRRGRLGALRMLLDRSNDENHYEMFWLRHRIGETEDQPGHEAHPRAQLFNPSGSGIRASQRQ